MAVQTEQQLEILLRFPKVSIAEALLLKNQYQIAAYACCKNIIVALKVTDSRKLTLLECGADLAEIEASDEYGAPGEEHSVPMRVVRLKILPKVSLALQFNKACQLDALKLLRDVYIKFTKPINDIAIELALKIQAMPHLLALEHILKNYCSASQQVNAELFLLVAKFDNMLQVDVLRELDKIPPALYAKKSKSTADFFSPTIAQNLPAKIELATCFTTDYQIMAWLDILKLIAENSIQLLPQQVREQISKLANEFQAEALVALYQIKYDKDNIVQLAQQFNDYYSLHALQAGIEPEVAIHTHEEGTYLTAKANQESNLLTANQPYDQFRQRQPI